VVAERLETSRRWFSRQCGRAEAGRFTSHNVVLHVPRGRVLLITRQRGSGRACALRCYWTYSSFADALGFWLFPTVPSSGLTSTYLLLLKDNSLLMLGVFCSNFSVYVNPITPELNPSAQRCLTRFFSGDFASWTVHFVNMCICVKNQEMQHSFSLLIMYGSYYMFRHYIAIFRERSECLLRDAPLRSSR
jgi:hypothetical protein